MNDDLWTPDGWRHYFVWWDDGNMPRMDCKRCGGRLRDKQHIAGFMMVRGEVEPV